MLINTLSCDAQMCDRETKKKKKALEESALKLFF